MFYFCGVMLASPANSEISLVQNLTPHNCRLNIKYRLIGCDIFCVQCEQLLVSAKLSHHN